MDPGVPPLRNQPDAEYAGELVFCTASFSQHGGKLLRYLGHNLRLHSNSTAHAARYAVYGAVAAVQDGMQGKASPMASSGLQLGIRSSGLQLGIRR